MKNYVIVSLFCNPESENNNRVNSIRSALRGNIQIITSDFDHGTKTYYDKQKLDRSKAIYIHVPQYKRNIGIKRLYSHVIFAFRLRKVLNSLAADAVYCTMPSSTSAFVCGNYCKKKNIKFIIDVIDLWPDSLVPVSRIYSLLTPFLYIWKSITTSAYKRADIILGESKKYVAEAMRYNSIAVAKPLYLGIDKAMVNKLIENSDINIEKSDDEVWICYAGSLGYSYDFDSIFNALHFLNDKVKYHFWFVGDGVLRVKIESKIKNYNINATVTGYLAYGDLLKYLSMMDIAINIFKENTRVVHSYKFNDYVATNCFILNSLQGETAEMIEQYKIGLNFDFKEHTLDKVLLQCLKEWDYYKKWKVNNERLVNEVLDKGVIYSKIEELFFGLAF